MRALAHFLLVLGASFTALSAAPQRQDEGRPTFSIEAHLVTLSVTVVDRQGAFVGGLTREQFKVYDNGRLQPIDFFTNEDIPATVGLVIDCSSSMRGRRAQVTAAGTGFAAVSHPLDEFFIMNFNEVVWPGLAPRVPFTRSVDELREALAGAPALGMTALYDAVHRSLEHLELATRDRRVLVIVSDGGDNASSHTFDDVVAYARQTRTVIYAVMLYDEDDREAKPHVLKALARETGGGAFRPKSARDMMKVFTQIALEIRSGYTIGVSPPSGSDQEFRGVRVIVDDVDHRQLTARTRRGYDAGHAAGQSR